MGFLTQGTGYNRGFTLWKLKAYTWFEYLSICTYVKCQKKKLTFKNLRASFNCFRTPLGCPSAAIGSPHKQLVAALLSPSSDVWTRFQTSDLPHTVYPHLPRVLPHLSERTTETTKAKTILYSLHQACTLTFLRWEFKKNPACLSSHFSLKLPCPLGAALSNSSMQACPHLASVTVYLWCSFYLRLHSYQHRHIRALNFTAILAHHTSSSLFHPDKWQHSPQSF